MPAQPLEHECEWFLLLFRWKWQRIWYCCGFHSWFVAWCLFDNSKGVNRCLFYMNPLLLVSSLAGVSMWNSLCDVQHSVCLIDTRNKCHVCICLVLDPMSWPGSLNRSGKTSCSLIVLVIEMDKDVSTNGSSINDIFLWIISQAGVAIIHWINVVSIYRLGGGWIAKPRWNAMFERWMSWLTAD